MLAALLVSLVVQAPPKASMLGKGRPWWETLKRGDVVQLHAIPGTAIPAVKPWRWSEEQGARVRDDVYLKLFAEAASRGRWEEIHRMADRDRVEPAFAPATVQVVAIRDDPGLGCRVAEVVVLPKFDRNGIVLDAPRPREIPDPYPSRDTVAIPVAYLGAPGQPRHPGLDRLPVLVRRTRDISRVDCTEGGCSRLDAVPYAEAERDWREKQRRSEEIKKKADAARRGR
jgi:hypothetical protein